MNSFIIHSNEFLSKSISGYYHQEYTRFGADGNPDFINHVKNQFGDTSDAILRTAVTRLKEILEEDLLKIKDIYRNVRLTVCVVPRAKAESAYSQRQKLFRRAVAETVTKLNGYNDGTSYVVREKNTRTTHMNRSGYGGDGEMPYPGITNDTCKISHEVKGKDILLIDDIYTKTINIDEDAIQALLDKGAKSVIFYSVANTKAKSFSAPFSAGKMSSGTDDLPF